MMQYKFNMDDEVICDHLVSAQMKKIWAVQLAMVGKFAEVCERHGLKWFASGGTLIGAVRHQGYIPWDDDVDIHMLAEDYEKFCLVAAEELAPYFWQECRTKPGFSPWHAKIRDSRTTGCTQWEIDNWPDYMNKGIFIDIFPLYYIPDGEEAYAQQQRAVKQIAHQLWLFHWNRHNVLHPETADRNDAYAKEFAEVYRKYTYEDLCRLYLETCQSQRTPTKYVGATSFNCLEPRFVWPVENYREMVDLPFMGGTIKGPIGWDACLKQQYGDYMKIVKGGSMHSSIVFDTETPFAEKLRH